jgi:hypothetical protein
MGAIGMAALRAPTPSFFPITSTTTLSRIPFRDRLATLRTALTSSFMAFNNSSNVDARGSTFFDIGRDQINNFNISLANSGTKQNYSSLTRAQRLDPQT